MADDKKISELAVASTPLAGTELIEIVQGGVNKQTTASQLGGTVPDASESTKGIAEIAEQSEVNTGTDDTRIVTALKLKNRDGAVATLSDGSTVDITSDKWTLATSSSTRTFTFSFTGDKSEGVITLSATALAGTFPAACLCVSEGVASGDNTSAMAGVSGDKYYVSIRKISSGYFVVIKNFGQ